MDFRIETILHGAFSGRPVCMIVLIFGSIPTRHTGETKGTTLLRAYFCGRNRGAPGGCGSCLNCRAEFLQSRRCKGGVVQIGM